MANRGLCTRWFRQSELDEFYKVLKVGDRVEFHRGLYSHWAICIREARAIRRGLDSYWTDRIEKACPDVTDAHVVHRLRANPSDGSEYGETNVVVAKLSDVVGPNKVRINNARDTQWNPLTQENIAKFAFNAVDHPFFTGYHLLNRNCHHFVDQCRYGKDLPFILEDD